MSSPAYGPTAGLSASQAISLSSTQEESQLSLYPPGSLLDSQESDSTTGASHLDQNMEDDGASGTSFINDASQPIPAGEFTPSASQDLAGLSPPGSLSATRIMRPPPGTYRERSGSATSHEENSAPDHTPDSDQEDGTRTPTGRPAPLPTTPATSSSTANTGPSPAGPILPPPTLPASASPSPSPQVHTSAGDELTPGMGGMQASTRPAVVATHFLLGQRLYRIATEGHPVLDWAVVRDASATTAVIPAGCLHHELPAGVNPADGHVQFVLRGALLNAVTNRLASFPGVRLFTVEIQSGRRRWVRIHFAVPEAMAAASNLSVDFDPMGDTPGFSLSAWEAGAPLGARYIPLQVNHQGMAPHAANRALLLAVRATRCLHVIETWQINHHIGRNGPSTPTQTLLALLFARPTRGGSPADALSVDERRAAPTFLGANPTLYPGRFPQCSGANCRWVAQQAGSFHTRYQCGNDTAPCAVCNRPGHVGRDCPSHLQRSDDASAPSLSGPAHDEADEYGYGTADPSYAPTGPLPFAPYPLGLPAATPVVPVASSASGTFSTGSAPSRGSARGRGRGSHAAGRTHYQQMVLTPTGGFGPATSEPTSTSDPPRASTTSNTTRSVPASPARTRAAKRPRNNAAGPHQSEA